MSDDALTILHVDMDAFYAAIEQRDQPELRGQPVVVGGSSGNRGVVCAASYEARVFGIHSAMPAATARRLCPQAIFLPVRMDHYATVGRQVREIFRRYTPLVEPLSLDEAFLDVRGCEGLFGPAPRIGLRIKDDIRRELCLVASVGVATNKFLAKLASDHGKPDGYVVLRPTEVRGFLDQLPVSRLWGVGAKGEARLKRLGLHSVKQLAAWPESLLVSHLGELGRHLFHLAQGVDDRPVVSEREAKSVSTETTFSNDVGDVALLRTWLLSLVEELGARLRSQGVLAKALDLKLRSSEFRTWSRSQTLPAATNHTETLWATARALLQRSLQPQMLPLRLLGIGANRLTTVGDAQADLFEQRSPERERRLDDTVDELRERFGDQAIQRASLLDPAWRERAYGPHGQKPRDASE